MKLLTAALIALLPGMALAFQQAPEKAAPTQAVAALPEAEIIAKQLPSYPLHECPISHEGLDAMGKPLDLVHEGRLVRLCCKSCLKEFKQDPAAVLKTIDAAVVAEQKPTYALKTCPISGEELGGMGEPVDYVNGTRLVRLCCKNCIKGFQKEPAKAMATVDAALIAEQKKTYPLTTCLVAGEPIKGEGFDQLYGTRLTRFCCEKCAATFAKEPAKYLAVLDKAPKAGPKDAGKKEAEPKKN
jgi:YHS domain-containing protein